MNTSSNYQSGIYAYRVFYCLVIATLLLGWFNFHESIEYPIWLLLGITAIAPVFARFMLNQEKPVFLAYHAGILMIFTVVVVATNFTVGLALMCLWGVDLFVALLIGFVLPKKKSQLVPASRKAKQLGAIDEANTSANRVIQAQIEKADQEIVRYMQKLEPLKAVLEKTQHYLKGVEERLAYPHLSNENRQTSLKLKDTLQTSLDNYSLMVQFFEEAKSRYQKEKRNLEEKMRNLEIIDFLNDTDRVTEISSIEKSAFHIEFQQHLHKLEDELPVVEAQMDAKIDLLSHDLKEELRETIQWIQHL